MFNFKCAFRRTINRKDSVINLELENIQSGVLRPRPTPFAATYIIARINDKHQGRALMGRASEIVSSAANPHRPGADAWMSLALSFEGLRALGVPQSSLESFPIEFQQGMAARAKILGDHGRNNPETWEKPLGTSDAHVLIAAIAPTREQLDGVLKRADQTFQQTPGVQILWRQNCFAPEDEKEHFGFRDGISHPAIEGSGIPGSNLFETPLKAGEFVLGYTDETGAIVNFPQPEVLGRNGTFVVLRKLHQDVASFRKYLHDNAKDSTDEEFLAAKMMGRWRSGAPLSMCPHADNPELGADKNKNNAFQFFEDDKIGYKTPLGSHIRRMNPRDGLKEHGTFVNIRRMIRRGTVYGPHLPSSALEDDGVDRGLMFLFIGAHLRRQFEFVQATWMNDGEFIGAENHKDPIAGCPLGHGDFTIPNKPLRRQLKNIPQFVTTRGGEYFFMPGIPALRWLSEMKSP